MRVHFDLQCHDIENNVLFCLVCLGTLSVSANSMIGLFVFLFYAETSEHSPGPSGAQKTYGPRLEFFFVELICQ